MDVGACMRMANSKVADLIERCQKPTVEKFYFDTTIWYICGIRDCLMWCEEIQAHEELCSIMADLVTLESKMRSEGRIV